MSKVVICELTPRKDIKDLDAKACNDLISEKLNNNSHSKSNITMAFHKNLRNDEMSFHYDDKHISKSCIPKFAANIKLATRKAFDINNSLHKKNSHFIKDKKKDDVSLLIRKLLQKIR